jgi:hypothetical protein
MPQLTAPLLAEPTPHLRAMAHVLRPNSSVGAHHAGAYIAGHWLAHVCHIMLFLTAWRHVVMTSMEWHLCAYRISIMRQEGPRNGAGSQTEVWTAVGGALAVV